VAKEKETFLHPVMREKNKEKGGREKATLGRKKKEYE